MGESPSSQVFFEMEGLVSDALQVISYKWLSRKFSVPSNIAKRLLERFITQNPRLDLEIVYAVSGWTKTDPQCYSIQLVPKLKLEGAKAALRENPSVHVYSVQRCLPKDPAQLWSADFVQAVELFSEPQDVNNCLRDNRFSAVACGGVQRSLARKTSGSTASPQTPVPVSKPPSGLETHPIRHIQDAPEASLFPRTVGADIKPVKSEILAVSRAQTNIPPKDVSVDIAPVKNETPSSSPGSEHNAIGVKANVLAPATGKRKAVATAAPAGGIGGGSISNLWGKAASKPKAPSPPKASVSPALVVTAGDAEARIQAMEACGYSDEDVEQHASSRAKRTTGRRKMIVEDDDSENEEAEDTEMIVRIATPNSSQDVKPPLHNGHAIPTISKNQKPEVSPKPSVSETKVSNVLQDKNVVAGNLQPAKSMKTEETVEKTKAVAKEAPGMRVGQKRKKVMHTRIDEKGREVTEVVWITEGEETVPKDEMPQVMSEKPSAPTSKESDSKASAERSRALPKHQPAPPKVPPSRGKSAVKSGGKQQGSIMSFFKKQS